MRYLLLVLLSFSSFAGVQEQMNTFNEIILAQGKALEKISVKEHAAGKFHMTDMITDIGISKTGILGLSALKSTNSIELRWKRKTQALNFENKELVVPADLEDLDHLSDTIAALAEKSGKVKNISKAEIKEALTKVQEKIQLFSVTEQNAWKLSGIRLDLNFSASGKVTFLTSAGTSLRIRLEWLVKNKFLKTTFKNLNEESRTVAKVLADLNRAKLILIPGFEIKKVTLGFGSSVKKSFGVWKYSSGFIGALIFVPVVNPHLELVSIPSELKEMPLEVNGFEEEETTDKWRLPWRRSYSVSVNFSRGLERSLDLASSFVRMADAKKFPNWYISEVKTVNDISKSGAFGFANVSARGFLEIDHKRINP